jgi:hypothetical protein
MIRQALTITIPVSIPDETTVVWDSDVRAGSFGVSGKLTSNEQGPAL